VVTRAAAAAEPAANTLVASPQGELPLPWLREPLDAALAGQRGHALLLHGASGAGALPFVLTLAQAWLCESPQAVGARRPCGHCGSCRLVQSRLHPDLIVLMPETLRRQHHWPLREDKPDGEDSKRKPSRQIRIPEVRALIDWAHQTSARGQGKVAVLHPAEAMNGASANALLKTLEEPPLGTRLLLSTADPALLLPTVLSRCQHLRLGEPPRAQALAWLEAQGVDQPQVLWAAAGGRPLDALLLSQSGVGADAWAALPQAVARGQAGAMAGWAVPQWIDALQKLCTDALALAAGAQPRYFPAGSLPALGGQPALPALLQWSDELARVARHDEHPWNEALLLDAMLGRAREALTSAGRATRTG
jgi:DNA polymerase III subunit delta'